MINSITIEDIKELLSKFGILIKETEDGEVSVFDNDNNEIMDAISTGLPSSLVSRDDISKVIMTTEMTKTGHFISFKSSNKFLCYYLRLATNPNGERYASLSEIFYMKRRADGYIEDTRATFEKSPMTDGQILINTIIYSGDAPIKITERKEIIIYGNGEMQFELNSRTGFLENGSFVEGWYLEESEIRKELKSNEVITILAECYGKQYPKILETLETAKVNAGIKR